MTTEHAIQKAIVEFLDLVLPSSIRAVAVANNPRSRSAGGREKARGMRRGFPDLVLVGGFHALFEVKRRGSYLRPEQRAWREWALAAGVPHATVRGVDDVREALADWGVPTREVQS